MSGDTFNQPAQPSYGEGMADALKAQVELLTGTGDFASTGSLESLLPLEESIRKKTAQTDTDILRQTLLGSEQKVVKDPETGKYGIPGAEPVTNDQGQVQSAGGGRYQIIKTDTGKDSSPEKERGKEKIERGVGATYSILDTKTGGVTETFGGEEYGTYIDGAKSAKAAEDSALKAVSEKFQTLQTTIDEADGNTDAVAQTFEFTNPNTGEPLKEGDVVRQEDGMVDLLGDKRGVQNTVARPDYEQYVRNNPEYMAEVARDNTAREQQGLPPRSLAEWGEAHYARVGESDGDELPVTYEQADSGRQAGFDESGNFLGLSAFGEDIQAGNLSRQRERDLQDVARLSGTYQDIMEDYKPGTQEALESARSVLESQKESLTGAGAIGGPQGITDPLSLTSKGFDAAQNTTPVDLKVGTSFEGAQVADPTTLSAPTSYTPSAGVTGSGYTATAGLDGGQILQNDPVRAALMKDAEAALGQGLTSREKRQIEEAARARSTMMGRTFDQKGAIDEAKAQVLEDNQRKMQNRAFAQSALGQEAGFQESDLGRALQAGIQNQAAKNRAGEFTAGQDMQAQLANQQATNRASEFGVQAGLGQEQLSANMAQQKAMADAGFTQQARATELEAGLTQEQAEAQLNQQRLMANQQFSQEANKYGAQEDMQVQLNNLANQISNYQFETGSQMDADRLNEQLTQSGILGYIQAAGGLAALEDSSTLDPFQAVLGRGGGGSLQAGQSVFGQAGYGLNSAPQYLNPESGLGYIQNQATNAANMYNAQVGADATKTAGLYSGLGSLGGGLLGGAGAQKKLFG